MSGRRYCVPFSGLLLAAGLVVMPCLQNRASPPMEALTGNQMLQTDIAAFAHRQEWLHHPLIGDPSFDNFERLPGNPIYRGKPPYEWPVNGFLFRDPISGFRYVYFTLYPRGYLGRDIKMGLLRSKDGKSSWEILGEAADFIEDNVAPGRTVADPAVLFHAGKYFMSHAWWATGTEERGMACAVAERPEGPFRRLPDLFFTPAKTPLLGGVYGFIYGTTLVRRQHDWLALSDLSRPGNAQSPNPGGVWALGANVAKNPGGPYGPTTILISPQSKVYHPTPVEWFPVFTHEDHVYAPATSLGANRDFQILYRAPIEEAHRAEAWQIFQCGSVWHSEPVPNEAYGIWGQTFSGYVENGLFQVLSHSKDSTDTGTLNLAQRSWDNPYRDGFALSAPSAPSLALYQREFATFHLQAAVRCNGPKILIWNHDAPLGGSTTWHAGGGPHELTLSSCTPRLFPGSAAAAQTGPARGRADGHG